ncbi:hypothetical protein MUK42_19429 [Musa troglodytarum]|uniref:Uncharacterized protein n=1 Tax=Musa troglodytarum TaxID=320322 RepID=A0A9E7FP73_9LILI|nr:hypothetical protein MUK42_19429 [Musa troglodytarum]
MEPQRTPPQALPPILLRRPADLRPHEDQSGARSQPELPEVVQGRHLRLLLHEHRRQQHRGLSEARRRRYLDSHDDHPSPPHVRHQGPRCRPHQLLPAAQADRAMAEDQEATGEGKRVPAVAGGAEEARRALRVHSLRMLQHGMSCLLVESGSFLGTGCSTPCLPLGLEQYTKERIQGLTEDEDKLYRCRTIKHSSNR